MCGRAKLPDDVSEIKLDLKIDFDEIDHYQPRWNVAPTSQLPVVVSTKGKRVLTTMRWGLVPSWAKDIKAVPATFNARAEGIETRPAFRGAWRARRRCLVVADGYYEWRVADKQPFAVALGNRGPMTFAGLWDLWCYPTAPEVKPLKSFTIITTPANELVTEIHDRMPLILAPRDYARWLSDEPDPRDLMRPFPATPMRMWPISTRVNKLENDDPSVVEPIESVTSAA